MITATQYVEKKNHPGGPLVEVAKIGKAHAMAVKRFSQEDGTEADAEVFGVSIEELEKKKAILVQEIADVDVLITDLQALDAPVLPEK